MLLAVKTDATNSVQENLSPNQTISAKNLACILVRNALRFFVPCRGSLLEIASSWLVEAYGE